MGIIEDVKFNKVERMRAAVDVLRMELTAYARAHGGRYVLFGSAARGELRHDSDVDLLVDFAEDQMSAAEDYVEDLCARLGLRLDMLRHSRRETFFMRHIRPDVVDLK